MNFAINSIYHAIVEEVKIRRALIPAPVCGAASLDHWIRAQLGNRGGSNFEVPESKHETSENGLTRMHLDTHSYLSHIS